MTTIGRAQLYKTAKATVSCAEFKAGDIVSIEYDFVAKGVIWYLIKATEHGPTSCVVAYPEHHLTEFCL